MRGKIGLNMGIPDVVAEMSEGNPGAINVMMLLLKDDPTIGLFDILHLDDMNIWGSQIWVGFKDYCGGDLEKFKAALKARDPEMVALINKECPSSGPAVTSGASYSRPGEKAAGARGPSFRF